MDKPAPLLSTSPSFLTTTSYSFSDPIHRIFKLTQSLNIFYVEPADTTPANMPNSDSIINQASLPTARQNRTDFITTLQTIKKTPESPSTPKVPNHLLSQTRAHIPQSLQMNIDRGRESHYHHPVVNTARKATLYPVSPIIPPGNP